MLTAQTRLRRSPQCAFQDVGGRVVVVLPRQRTIHELNEVGSFLWSLLEEPVSVRDLSRRVCEEFEVEPGTAERDVVSFGDEMVEQGLLEVA